MDALDIRELQYFVQVADLGNYSAAAERLYISQPALSKVVQKLETELGYDLFYTDQRQQKLTPEGRELQEKFLRVMREFRDISRLVVSARHPLAGRTSVRLEELKREAFILSGGEYAVSRTIRAACRRVDFEPNVALISSRWDFIVQLVQQDCGVAIQPRPSKWRAASRAALVTVGRE